MLACFTFRAKAGKEKEFETLLDNAEAGRGVARAMGATRNTLFLRAGRMVRVLEFPDGATPRPLAEIAREDPAIHAFLAALGPLIEDGFDVDAPRSLDAFNRRAVLPLAYDVRP
jgi:hypothetical protein